MDWIDAEAHQHLLFFFFFNDTATTEIYTLSLHDALPISLRVRVLSAIRSTSSLADRGVASGSAPRRRRSEEHTSELQSHLNLVCRLLLEKKNRQATGIRDRPLHVTSLPHPVDHAASVVVI